VVPRVRAKLALALGVAGLGAALAGPAAYAVDTVATPHSGAIPSAGPAVQGATQGGPGGFSAGAFGAGGRLGATGGPPTGFGRGFGSSSGRGVPSFGANGGFPGAGQAPTGGVRPFGARTGTGTSPQGGAGFLNSSTPGHRLVTLLEHQSDKYRWVAATVDSNSAAGYQLATDDPVMAIGGFNGTDPTPTLAQFETYVRNGDIHYFIASGGGAGAGGLGGAGFGGTGTAGGTTTTSTSSAITQWVENHYAAQTVNGVTIYDLTATPTS
jgi:hypothetical protein